MIDFTSALYLGMRHATSSLRPWTRLTTGVPAALESPPEAEEVARQMALLQGCEAGLVGTSTLHQFWDLVLMTARSGMAIYTDHGTYPIAQWGVERAAGRGIRTSTFRHHDPEALTRQLRHPASRGLRPLVIADGICPGCGGALPIHQLLDVIRPSGGILILDDTQSLGIMGESPNPRSPFGRGGGGSLRWHGVAGEDIVLVTSLAKGFGVPMAVLSAASDFVAGFAARSETRVHSSPPSLAHLHAAEQALLLNREHGDSLRNRLLRAVRRFRAGVQGLGLELNEGLFPVQSLVPVAAVSQTQLHRQLLERGMRTVLHRPRCVNGPRISFLITARHRTSDIDAAVEALAGALRAAA
jgi:8-amino-7-oxononanoate synthase